MGKKSSIFLLLFVIIPVLVAVITLLILEFG